MSSNFSPPGERHWRITPSDSSYIWLIMCLAKLGAHRLKAHAVSLDARPNVEHLCWMTSRTVSMCRVQACIIWQTSTYYTYTHRRAPAIHFYFTTKKQRERILWTLCSYRNTWFRYECARSREHLSFIYLYSRVWWSGEHVQKLDCIFCTVTSNVDLKMTVWIYRPSPRKQ